MIAPIAIDEDRDAFASYISGLVDGEGCFDLRFHAKQQTGQASLIIALRADDGPILEQARDFWGCGLIRYTPGRIRRGVEITPRCILRFQRHRDMTRILMPHFERYPLRAKKHRDYLIWKQGVELLSQIKHRSRKHRWNATNRAAFIALRDSLRSLRKYNGQIILPPIRVGEMIEVQRELF